MKQQEFNNIAEQILFSSLTTEDVVQIVKALRLKKYIVSAVFPATPQSESFGSYLKRFWDWDHSPYIREKNLVGQNIHKRYVAIMQARVKKYWIPKLGSKPLGAVTKTDVKNMLFSLASPLSIQNKNLSSETVNQIMRAATLALKWAYKNGLTKTDCFSGIAFCRVTHKKRLILSFEQAKQLFSKKWKHPSHRLANLIAMCTGMRIGEIQALQIRDIEFCKIHVRHNWARMDGLKCTKNGEERQIKIPIRLYEQIKSLLQSNPYGQQPSNFLFWGHKKDCPAQARHWNESLHEELKQMNVPEWKEITFHSWRHFFTANMADLVEERKLQFVTGHKSLQMLEHYANHESEKVLDELKEVSCALFSPMLQ